MYHKLFLYGIIIFLRGQIQVSILGNIMRVPQDSLRLVTLHRKIHYLITIY